MLLIAALAALSVGAAPSPSPAARPSPIPCSSDSGFHALDFWVGTWRVTSGGQYAGSDVVTSILDGCAVVENWTDADGSHGMSLFYYNAFDQTWAQVWVTDRATARGELKEKYLIARFPDGGTRFQGRLPGAPGSAIILDRTTLTPVQNGTVHQLIEISRDGGSTWTTTFDAIYARAAQHGTSAAGQRQTSNGSEVARGPSDVVIRSIPRHRRPRHAASRFAPR